MKIRDNLDALIERHPELYEAYSQFGRAVHEQGGPLGRADPLAHQGGDVLGPGPAQGPAHPHDQGPWRRAARRRSWSTPSCCWPPPPAFPLHDGGHGTVPGVPPRPEAEGGKAAREDPPRTAPLRLVRHRPAVRRLPRPGMGRPGPRRPPPVRDADPGGRPGRPQLDHRAAQARGLPAGLRRASTRRRWRSSAPSALEALLQDPGIVRNRLKVASAVANARAFLAVQARVRQLRRLPVARRGRAPGGEPLALPGRDPRRHPGGAGPERGPAPARLQVRGAHHHVRLHAGRGHGGRPRARLLEAPVAALPAS